MKKRTIIAILGILVALLPLIDVPSSWKNSMMVFLGLFIALLAGVRTRQLVVPLSTSEIHKDTSTS